MARTKRKAGRPKGSKNKKSILRATSNGTGIHGIAIKKRGRPKAAGKRRGRPTGIKSKNQRSLLVPGGHVNGIHFIGKSLIIDTNLMKVDEVIFLGGKTPKVR